MNFRKATTDDCESINRIASQIWAPTYSHLMSVRQLEYMFEMMYSPENLRKAMIEGGQTFLIFFADDETSAAEDGVCVGDDVASVGEGDPIAYVAYEILADHDFYLQKIYLLPARQGQGAGRQMLEAFLDHLRRLDPEARRLRLNVNRENHKAIAFYHRNGFETVGRRDHHIGRGYFMNDYIMERDIW